MKSQSTSETDKNQAFRCPGPDRGSRVKTDRPSPLLPCEARVPQVQSIGSGPEPFGDSELRYSDGFSGHVVTGSLDTSLGGQGDGGRPGGRPRSDPTHLSRISSWGVMMGPWSSGTWVMRQPLPLNDWSKRRHPCGRPAYR